MVCNNSRDALAWLLDHHERQLVNLKCEMIRQERIVEELTATFNKLYPDVPFDEALHLTYWNTQ